MLCVEIYIIMLSLTMLSAAINVVMLSVLLLGRVSLY
jgi:hypothetical protein